MKRFLSLIIILITFAVCWYIGYTYIGEHPFANWYGVPLIVSLSYTVLHVIYLCEKWVFNK